MKLKYLLLGLIISFIGIFNFSSAWEGNVYCDKDTSACNTRNLSACCEVENSTSFTCTNEGDIKVYRLKLNGNVISMQTITCPMTYYVDTMNYKLLAYGGAGLTQGYYLGETDIMPVSVLSPVVDGLEDSINEFIPYVIYIGLGLISALIGFVFIKWLINWVRGKSLGVFRFKRKK